MKSFFTFLSFLTVLMACRKTIIPAPEQQQQKQFRIVINQLPGAASTFSDLKAVVQLLDNRADTILNRELALEYDNQYQTPVLTLPRGNYTLAGLWITRNNKVVFVSPKAGSAKASEVYNPLNRQFSLNAQHEQHVLAEVARVEKGNIVSDFGYPEGAFKLTKEDDELYQVMIRPTFTIGSITYDSVPAKLTINSWFADGSTLTSVRELQPGTSTVLLHRKAERHQLIIKRWNMTDELELTPETIDESELYTPGGARAEKKLKESLLFQASNGIFKPLEKTTYTYLADQLMQLDVYRKTPDNTTFLAETHKLTYQQKKVSRIDYFNEAGNAFASNSLTYSSSGQLSKTVYSEGDKVITATISYTPYQETNRIDDYTIGTHVQYNDRHYTETYSNRVIGGLRVLQEYATSHGTSSKTDYGYDFNINPYAHLGLPETYLSNYSIHNNTVQYSVYAAGHPDTKPIEFSYTYDNEGYPKEQIVKYHYILTGDYAYSRKTIFVYEQ